jgi:hypothetical protein
MAPGDLVVITRDISFLTIRDGRNVMLSVDKGTNGILLRVVGPNSFGAFFGDVFVTVGLHEIEAVR